MIIIPETGTTERVNKQVPDINKQKSKALYCFSKRLTLGVSEIYCLISIHYLPDLHYFYRLGRIIMQLNYNLK